MRINRVGYRGWHENWHPIGGIRGKDIYDETFFFSFRFESEYLSHIFRDISRDDLGSNSIGIWLRKGGLSRERFIRNLVPMLTRVRSLGDWVRNGEKNYYRNDIAFW